MRRSSEMGYSRFMASSGSKSQPITISETDVEHEITRLFGGSDQPGLVIRVHGGDGSASGRSAAFHELLQSLKLYDFHSGREEIRVEAPDVETVASALSVLADPSLKRRLFERILLTFGKRIVDPLGQILDTTPGGALLAHMARMRHDLLDSIHKLKLTHETQQILNRGPRKTAFGRLSRDAGRARGERPAASGYRAGAEYSAHHRGHVRASVSTSGPSTPAPSPTRCLGVWARASVCAKVRW